MITYLEKPHKKEELDKILNPMIKQWFFSKFKEFSLPQLYGVLEIHNENNILISAPTGSTKTLTSFLSILNELINLSENNMLEDKTYAVYISPLKALSNDIQINLKTPLEEMEKLAEKKFGIRIAVRTGDTTASEKQKMSKKAPHILITTPESLAIVLTSTKFIEHLKSTRYIIVDEIHALADSKRGTHLSLSLERLQSITETQPTRIGLSATISPLEEIAQFLVGLEDGKTRPCKIVDVQFIKKMDLKVISPVPDIINIAPEKLHTEMYSLLDSLIQEHKTTLIFTNTRSATERVVYHLKEKFPQNYTENIGAHHGSLSKEHRFNIEQKLREGKLKVVVCSTSLELGIDIGYIDLVILLGSPKSVARALQRIGRSGHRLHETSKGRIIVLDRDDLVECSVLLKSAIEKKIDKIHIPKNCLDVLAQQIYGIAISNQISYKELYSLVRQAYPYKDLSMTDFREIIEYLSGEYSSLEDRHIYAKIWYDKETGMIGKKGKLARMIYMTNIGTIPDESFISVKIGEQTVGHIDELFLEKLKRGDVFILGGNRYIFLFSRGMTAQVQATVSKLPTIPSWFSEMLPLSFDLAMEIGKFRRLVEEKMLAKRNKEEIIKFILDYLYLDENAANAIYEYFREQFLYKKEIPNDKKIVIEYCYAGDKKKYVIFHSLYGRRVNDVLSRALAYAISRFQHKDVEIGINDNGFYLSSETNIQATQALSKIKSSELQKIMELAIDKTQVLSRRFRHVATRALMILREYKGKRKNVGRQQVSSMILMNALKRISPNFSLIKETKREVFEDLMDINNAELVLKQIEDEKIKIKEINTTIPSPFAFNLIIQAHTDIYKIEDKQEFIQRMHNLVMAKIGKENKI